MMTKIPNYSQRPIEPTDLETMLEWRNSDRVRRVMYTDQKITLAEHKVWFEKIIDDPSNEYWLLECSGTPIGLQYITRIDRHQGRCEWGGYIGADEAAKGAGTKLLFFGLERVFEGLDMRRVCCELFSFNEKALKLYLRLGFKEEGRLKAHYLKNGRFEDVVLMAMFADDWLKNKERALPLVLSSQELPV